MARRIQLSERDLTRLIHRIVNEQLDVQADTSPSHGGPYNPEGGDAYVEPDYEGYYVGDDEETEVYHLDEPEFLKAVKEWCDRGGPSENEAISKGQHMNAWIESANLLSQAEAYCNTI